MAGPRRTMAPTAVVWKSTGRPQDAVGFWIFDVFTDGMHVVPKTLAYDFRHDLTQKNKSVLLQIGVWCCTSCCCKSTGAVVRCTCTE